MNIQQLKTLIKRGETEHLEFKKSTAQLHTAMQTICAFLNNDSGGTVLIGITEDAKIIGQQVSDDTRKAISVELSKIEPHPDVQVNYIRVATNRYIIVISTKAGLKPPYIYDGRPYFRSQSTTRRMPQEEYEQLLYNRRPQSISWERLTTNECTLNDLDKSLIRKVIQIGIVEGRISDVAANAGITEILKKLDLMIGDRLTNAAVVLFCKKEHKQFIQSSMQIARFRGIDKSEFIDNKAFRANAFELYEHAMKLLGLYLPVAARIENNNPYRVETPAVPYKVLREALVNALCHRDYANRGGTIHVAVYDDRVHINSSGRLPSGIHVSELSKEHKSHPRNPLIAHIFYICKMIERWGRGTQDMIKMCKESDNPIPQFEESAGSFSVILPLKEPTPTVTFPKSTAALLLTSRQKEILAILKDGALSREQIIEKMTNPPAVRTLQLELSNLKKQNLIKDEGSARSVVWVLINQK